MKDTYPLGIKLAICITMYSEDFEELKRTMIGVMQSLRELEKEEGINSDILD